MSFLRKLFRALKKLWFNPSHGPGRDFYPFQHPYPLSPAKWPFKTKNGHFGPYYQYMILNSLFLLQLSCPFNILAQLCYVFEAPKVSKHFRQFWTIVGHFGFQRVSFWGFECQFPKVSFEKVILSAQKPLI